MSDRVCSWSVDEGVSMYAEERQRTIVSLALRYDRVAVTELAQRFDVTTETIRRKVGKSGGKK